MICVLLPEMVGLKAIKIAVWKSMLVLNEIIYMIFATSILAMDGIGPSDSSLVGSFNPSLEEPYAADYIQALMQTAYHASTVTLPTKHIHNTDRIIVWGKADLWNRNVHVYFHRIENPATVYWAKQIPEQIFRVPRDYHPYYPVAVFKASAAQGNNARFDLVSIQLIRMDLASLEYNSLRPAAKILGWIRKGW